MRKFIYFKTAVKKKRKKKKKGRLVKKKKRLLYVRSILGPISRQGGSVCFAQTQVRTLSDLP